MGTMSIWHWLIVLLIVAIVFGTGKLKNIGKDLGIEQRPVQRTLAVVYFVTRT